MIDPDLVLRFMSIAIVNIVLSGDNVIVIGMAAASLPRDQRRLAIIGGGALAMVLRVAMAAITTRLMVIPLISSIGGLVLFVVAWGLVEINWERTEETSRRASSLRKAIELIVVADVTMSLDNVIAVAGTAHGDTFLLVTGLVISMPLLMIAGGLMSSLIDRFAWLAYLGATAICLTASRMILEDDAVASRLRWEPLPTIGVTVVVAVVLPILFRWLRLHKRHQFATRSGGEAD